MYGKIIRCSRDNNRIVFEYEKQICRLEVITDRIIHLFAGIETEEPYSYAVEEDKSVKTEYELEEKSDRIIISTKELIIEVFDEFKVDFYNSRKELLCADYRGQRLSQTALSEKKLQLASMEGHTVNRMAASGSVEIIKTMVGDEAFYGLGDKTGFLNKRGYEYEMWNSDIPDPQVDSFKSLYKSIPFFIALRNNSVYGIFFDNTYRSYFNMGKESEAYYYFGANNGNLDYYFIAGNKMAEIIEGYTYLTGRAPLPQLWTLGYHQSRWSYESKDEVYDIAKNFRDNDLPCDCIHLDIDYMEAYKVFTSNEECFPDFKAMTSELSQKGIKLVTIIDPGVKIEQGYPVYEEGLREGYFAKAMNGEVYENAVWPGPSVYPDFSDAKVRKWWGDLHTFLLDKGIRGVWNDMNEPASFNGELPDDVQFSDEGKGADHTKIHNIYGHLMAKATYEGLHRHDRKRPFVITRACYSGSQKYTTAWTGDNHSIWAHLQMAIPQLCNLGLSGMTFVGTDVGGFSSDCTPELLCRWVQVGCFSPFFRNHSCNGTRRQEPWSYNQETLDINRKYIKLRYQLLPYLYDLYWSSQKNGLPVMRPLVMEYEKDEKVREINDEFLVGSNVLVAPVVNQGQRVRSIYLPEGEWVDYWTKETVSGNHYILREAPLDLCPIYVRSGSIVPNYPEISYVGEKEITQLDLEVYPGICEYHHFQDNGEDYDYLEGGYNEFCFTIDGENQLEIKLLHQGYDKLYQSFRILWNGQEKIVPFQKDSIRITLK